MSSALQIRFAGPADAGTVFALVRELAKYERLLDLVTATEEGLRGHLFGERPAAEVLLAEVDGMCVGFALFFQNFSTFVGRPGMYLEDIFVRPEHRQRGYGKALMVTLARIARDRDYGRFEWSVLDWNTPAISFYHSIGAMPLDEWTVQRMTRSAIDQLAAQPLPGERG